MAEVSAASREMIERLIAFDTTSRNSNLELIEFIRSYLSELGVESELVHDQSGAKANLYATLGPKDRGGIALSGHTDVVPVDGQDWTRDPWKVVEQDGKLFGRGTCDMKGFIAVCLAWAPRFLEQARSMPVHFCFTYDEEVGCLGVRPLLAHLASKTVRPRMRRLRSRATAIAIGPCTRIEAITIVALLPIALMKRGSEKART